MTSASMIFTAVAVLSRAPSTHALQNAKNPELRSDRDVLNRAKCTNTGA
jgi:hypothetical protein